MKVVHYLPGGGLGDVVREAYFNNALGILRRWKLEHPRAELRVVTMSHNPAHADLFKGQDWIDEFIPLRFQLERGCEWQRFYEWYPEVLEGRTELRFTLPVQRSIYRPDYARTRPMATSATLTIQAVGMAIDVVLSEHDRAIAGHHRDRIVIHPFAGGDGKWIPRGVLDKLIAAAGTSALVVGGDFARPGHGIEHHEGIRTETFAPRVLIEIIRWSRAVIGTESSVYYVAGMWGRPLTMLWVPGGPYDLVKQGKIAWDWYLGEGHTDNLIRNMTDDPAPVLDWISTHRKGNDSDGVRVWGERRLPYSR